MKKLILPLIAITAAFAAGCFRPGIKGDGVITTENRPVTAFTAFEATGGFKIHWTPGKPSLAIAADQNLLPHIKTEVSGDTLRIRTDASLSPSKEIEITLSGESLAGVHTTGAGQVSLSQISSKRLRLESEGAVNLTADGSVEQLIVNLTGASRLSAKNLKSQNAKLELIGASDADVSVSEKLHVSVIGAGKLRYYGNPQVEQSTAGAGKIEHVE